MLMITRALSWMMPIPSMSCIPNVRHGKRDHECLNDFGHNVVAASGGEHVVE